MDNTPIISFSREYRFLSNFWPCQVIGPSDLIYPSVEHAYVAAKSLDASIHTHVSNLLTAGKAKRFGRDLELRSGWNDIKLPLMRHYVSQKFADPTLFNMLRSTGKVELIEGNTWGDTYWGQCPIGAGRNHLGKILMAIRDDISMKGTV